MVHTPAFSNRQILRGEGDHIPVVGTRSESVGISVLCRVSSLHLSIRFKVEIYSGISHPGSIKIW